MATPQTVGYWMDVFASYPPQTRVRFIDGVVCFDPPEGEADGTR